MMPHFYISVSGYRGLVQSGERNMDDIPLDLAVPNRPPSKTLLIRLSLKNYKEMNPAWPIP
jgi:hypothetical protein